MRIIFKNVGQGDSIILQWKKEGKKNIGIVDCKKVYPYNPVLDYIKSKDVDSINFMILTHPHYDHFSGFRELLNYCGNNEIPIENFLLTCYQDIVYLKSAVKSSKASSELVKMLIKLRELRRDKNIIKHLTHFNSDIKNIHLNDKIRIEPLAPTTTELEFFLERKLSLAEENQDSQPHGNWLSTILKVAGNDWYILLTSDVEQSVLKKIGHNMEERLATSLILCQAPHHGSLKNHSSEFWRSLDRRKAKVAISVGKNSYDHPDEKVIEKFDDYNYEIYSTNRVGALENESLKRDHRSDLLLNNIGIHDSKKEMKKNGSQDLEFLIENGIAKFVN
jgi:beta-lactamase superfamily II metal-dependent hydrolase